MVVSSLKNGIDVSIVIPTMNEELVIKQFLDWCQEGFRASGKVGEIIILDSSSDSTPKIAKANGATVISVSGKGLGNAYRAGQGLIKGKYVILGDADCTYDFRDITPFLVQLDIGFDFVIGNRFSGNIEKGSMPWHHQYFGSPATSFIFKTGLGLPVGDIHCGMRAMRTELYNTLPFLESGWEYATEMIVSARNLESKITEIPINFFKEPVGRVSHHKRGSWLSPFKAGWGTLRVITTYLIDRLFVIPGIILLAASTILNLCLFAFPVTFINLFHAGLLSQSILMFISSIGAFFVTTGLLARFAYRRKLHSLNFLAREASASNLFSLLVGSTILEVVLSFFAFYEWLRGLGKNLYKLEYSYTVISGWISFTSIYLCVLSVSIASLIGHHAQKFRN